MFGLPDLPVCNALASSQVSQKGFNILAGPAFQRFVLQKTVKVLRPPHMKPYAQNACCFHEMPSCAKASEGYRPVAESAEARISRHKNHRLPFTHSTTGETSGLLRRRIEGQTVRSYPVFLRARPVSFPKNIAIFGIANIHAFHPNNPCNFSRLDRNPSSNDRRNYHITI